MNKKKLSVRINPHNYDMVKAVADTFFYNETRNDGNVSQALDWILTNFRLYTKYKGLIHFLELHAQYERGGRTQEQIDALKHLVAFIETVERTTKTI